MGLETVEIVMDMVERAPSAVKSAATETPDLPDAIPEIVRAQIDQIVTDSAAPA